MSGVMSGLGTLPPTSRLTPDRHGGLMPAATVYRAYDAAGTLLYVGVAESWTRRCVQHASDKPWWGQVARMELEHFDDRLAAAQREATLIRDRRPRHNIVIPTQPPESIAHQSRRDPASAVLHWARRTGRATFSERDAFQALRGQSWCGTVDDLRAALLAMTRLGWASRQPEPSRRPPGRPSSPSYTIDMAAPDIGAPA